jgi:N4-gp56 family major capsid protein
MAGVTGDGYRQYSTANDGFAPSDIGPQIRTDYYQKKALIEAAKEMYFGQLADVTNMPKHFGKTIKMYHYLPLLSDQNINDQGIDCTGDGPTANVKITFIVTAPDAVTRGGPEGPDYTIVGEGTDEAAAILNAQEQAQALFINLGITWTGGVDVPTDYTVSRDAAIALGWVFTDNVTNGHGNGVATGVHYTGNLYGSSKDVGYIQGKLPVLSEHGGRVNRVGFKRIELEGSIEKLGFFDEYTQESLDFDSDSELEMHINREMVMGANEITEDMLQIDLLQHAGILRFGGSATATVELSGDDDDNTILPTLVTYDDLCKLNITLDENRTPKNTKIIKGSRMIDTKTLDACRIMYIGSELECTLKKMEDHFGNQAFIPVQQYADAGNLLRGEIGAIDQFRIVVVPEMMHWEAAGAIEGASATNGGYRVGVARETVGPITAGEVRYNVYPMLVVGSESFTTIGFQTDGKTVKFTITNKKPGKEIARPEDPYGEVGFMSIKWYYGFMIQRPERIALVKTVAEW